MDIMYFEDVEVGKKRTKSITYQVNKEERHWDPRSFHIDEVAAVSSVFGGLVACSAHIFSILSWFATHGQSRTASIAALGFDKLRMHHPVRPSDTLSCSFECLEKRESHDTLSCSFECLEKRESHSKQDRGIVRTLATISNQQNIEVFSAIVTTMVAKRSQ
jgi:acyl dehydratase